MPRCSIIKKDGIRCKGNTVNGETLCSTHLRLSLKEENREESEYLDVVDENVEMDTSPPKKTKSQNSVSHISQSHLPSNSQMPSNLTDLTLSDSILKISQDHEILINTLTQIKKSNDELKTRIADQLKRELLSEIKRELLSMTSHFQSVSITKKKKPIEMNMVNIEKKAKSIVYNEMKKNEEFLKSVRDHMVNSRLITPNIAQMPWVMVKLASDVYFNKLTEQDKDKYINEARKAITSSNNLISP
jgi:hypothetical protein